MENRQSEGSQCSKIFFLNYWSQFFILAYHIIWWNKDIRNVTRKCIPNYEGFMQDVCEELNDDDDDDNDDVYVCNVTLIDF